jgi:hypothetical protein
LFAQIPVGTKREYEFQLAFISRTSNSGENPVFSTSRMLKRFAEKKGME